MKEDPEIVKKLREEEKNGALKDDSDVSNIEKKDKTNILLVDDDPGIRLTVKYSLEEVEPDFNIISVKNGEECLDYLKKENPPDLILLDIMMPVMDGWDTAAEIKKNKKWNKIPIIFLTAKTDNGSKNYGGIVSEKYVTKPFDASSLKKVIDQSLEKK